MTDFLDRADALIAGGAIMEGVALVRDAAMRGDADALFQLSTWRLIGDPIPRDLLAGRRLLRAAAQAGHRDAALREVALAANGSGGQPDWRTACALLSAAADRDVRAAKQLELLGGMTLQDDGKPARVPISRPLSDKLDVHLFAGFATPAECRHIAAVGAERLVPALVVDPKTGQSIQHPVRTAYEALIGPVQEDLVIRALNLRFAAASGTDVTQGEALVVLRYAPGQEYYLHHDAFPDHAGSQRDWTMLLYLNEGYSGGATHFPEIGLTVSGRGGDMLLFRNVDRRGRPDPLARHAGLQVRSGVKWLATRWVRHDPIDPWTIGTGPRFAPPEAADDEAP